MKIRFTLLTLLLSTTVYATPITPVDGRLNFNLPMTADLDFQVYILSGLPSDNDSHEYDVIVRGVEFDGVNLPIRRYGPTVDLPKSGGWGLVVYNSQLTRENNVASFNFPTSILMPKEVYQYEVETYISGALAVNTAVPEPATLSLISFGLFFMRRKYEN